jgi:hypothetical protein
MGQMKCLINSQKVELIFSYLFSEVMAIGGLEIGPSCTHINVILFKWIESRFQT